MLFLFDFVSPTRRFCSGRIVVNKDAEDTNIFMEASELALAGRPLTDKKVFIPLSKDLLLPESLQPDEDLKQAERQRPSAEAIAAQKGSERYLAIIRSLLSLSGDGLANSAVLMVNLTGYVEEMGCAVTCLHALSAQRGAQCIHQTFILSTYIVWAQIVT